MKSNSEAVIGQSYLTSNAEHGYTINNLIQPIDTLAKGIGLQESLTVISQPISQVNCMKIFGFRLMDLVNPLSMLQQNKALSNIYTETISIISSAQVNTAVLKVNLQVMMPELIQPIASLTVQKELAFPKLETTISSQTIFNKALSILKSGIITLIGLNTLSH